MVPRITRSSSALVRASGSWRIPGGAATAKPADPIGPLVLSGLADATAGVLAGRAARVVPLTGTDASLGSLTDMLLRVSQMAGDLLQITELT
jgi:hypothetical protein